LFERSSADMDGMMRVALGNLIFFLAAFLVLHEHAIPDFLPRRNLSGLRYLSEPSQMAQRKGPPQRQGQPQRSLQRQRTLATLAAETRNRTAPQRNRTAVVPRNAMSCFTEREQRNRTAVVPRNAMSCFTERESAKTRSKHAAVEFALSAASPRIIQRVDAESFHLLHQLAGKSVLLIGDSQERRVVGHFCGSKADIIKLNRTIETSTGVIRPVGLDLKLTSTCFCCSLSHWNITICSFFHFGTVRPSWKPNAKLNTLHGEPYPLSQRLRLLERIFGKSMMWDLVVVNSGLWDLFRAPSGTFASWIQPFKSDKNFDFQSEYAAGIRNLLINIRSMFSVQTVRIVWRTIPHDFSKKARFNNSLIDVMNTIASEVCDGLDVPVFDWALRLVRVPQEWLAKTQGTWHFGREGSMEYYIWILRYLECLLTAREPL
jgi:hypothetical protein